MHMYSTACHDGKWNIVCESMAFVDCMCSGSVCGSLERASGLVYKQWLMLKDIEREGVREKGREGEREGWKKGGERKEGGGWKKAKGWIVWEGWGKMEERWGGGMENARETERGDYRVYNQLCRDLTCLFIQRCVRRYYAITACTKSNPVWVSKEGAYRSIHCTVGLECSSSTDSAGCKHSLCTHCMPSI